MAKITVACPHCHYSQEESDATISTVCRRCHQYFSLEYKGSGRRLRRQRPTRAVTCAQCGNEQKVYEDALSAVCASCGAHLSIGSYTLEGVVRQRVSTSGDIVFLPGVRYSGPEVRGHTVTVSGWIKARIRAVQELVLSKKSEVKGALIAPLIRVLKGAEAEAERVHADTLEADGLLRTGPLFARRNLLVRNGGVVEATAVTARDVTVEPGGSLSGKLDTTAAPVFDEGDLPGDGEN